MHYQPLTAKDKEEMLHDIGVNTFGDLLKGIPASLLNPKMDLPEALSELELQSLVRRLGAQNRTVANTCSFLGGGSYEHFIPSAVASITGRHEFYTAYTPYQPEAAQGTLQAIFEFQSMIAELMGLEVSNASHYDGSTSLAEAALLALRHTGRTKILVSNAVNPHYRQVLKTYLQGTSFTMDEFNFDKEGGFNRESFFNKLSEEVAGVIFQTPNFFGVLEDLEGVSDAVHAVGALLILNVYPTSLGVLKTPGEWGADVAVGEGQPLGIPVQFGGPYLGLFATTRALVRRVPGRLAGLTEDKDGKRAFCLTLQAREQHIRREKAASNICTNQALCALAAGVYMALLGKQGIKKVAELNMDRAHYLRQKISEIDGFEISLKTPIFNEFVVHASKPFREIQQKCLEKNIFAGISLADFYDGRDNDFLVCATETKTLQQLDAFVEVLRQC